MPWGRGRRLQRPQRRWGGPPLLPGGGTLPPGMLQLDAQTDGLRLSCPLGRVGAVKLLLQVGALLPRLLMLAHLVLQGCSSPLLHVLRGMLGLLALFCACSVHLKDR